MENFSSFSLPHPLMQALDKLQFKTPTPIQAQAIPVALKGTDILGSAQTGTGKTAAFGIPLICHLMANPDDCALVMAPTRELAVQVMALLTSLLGERSTIRGALLIGGEPLMKQFRALKLSPRLIVGTPGRIYDHLTRGTLELGNARFLVLDETDRMLDMGFSIQIEKILKFVPSFRQTLLFSATMPPNILKLAGKYLKDPVQIAVGAPSEPAKNVKQEVVHLNEEEKYGHLVSELDRREGSVLVFVKTKFGAERMMRQLRRDRHSVDVIHGDLRQNKRDRVLQDFRDQKHRIMVATDVAARGLDVPHIAHVINYDIPQSPEDYIHRIGRTARAGADGEALCFVTPSDRVKWRAIDRLLNPNQQQAASPSGGRPFPRAERERGAHFGKPPAQKRSRSSSSPRPPKVAGGGYGGR